MHCKIFANRFNNRKIKEAIKNNQAKIQSSLAANTFIAMKNVKNRLLEDL
jgi:hypothetical protein